MHLVALCRGRRPRRPAQAWHRSPWRASGGSLSFRGERKGGKNAAKTNGFGFLARAWCGMYRGPFSPANKTVQTRPVLSHCLLRLSAATRSALVLPVQTGKPFAPTGGRGVAPPLRSSIVKQCVEATLAVARDLVTEHRSSPPYSRITAPLFFSARPDWMSARVSSKSSLVCWPVFMSLQATTPAAISSPPRKIT